MIHMLAEDLRLAVLKAAFEGKLTKHDTNDTSVYETLKLLNVRTIESEDFDSLPKNWALVSFGDISTYCKTKKKINATMADPNLWMLDLEDIEKGGKLLVKKKVKDKKAIGDKTIFEKGDILYSKLRPYLLKILIADAAGICTPELVPFKMIGNVNSLFTMYYLKSPYVDQKINKETFGVKMPRVGTETMKSLAFPLPPSEEQIRIVTRIEELMKKIDEYEKIENQLVELQKKFPGEMKEALLQAAIQGKLTQSNEDDSYANELLVEIDRCKNDYVSARKIKGKELLPITQEDEENFELKPKWCLTRLGNLCTIIFMGKSPVYEKQKNGYLCIGQKNNQDNGFTTNGIKYVTKAFWESVPEYQHLRKNDVLLNTLGGGTVGRSGMYTIDDDAITDGHVMVIRFKDDATAKYVLTYLQLFRRFIEDSANGSTNQKFINLYDVKNYLIPLPPLSEQKRIVEKLEKLMNICDALNS